MLNWLVLSAINFRSEGCGVPRKAAVSSQRRISSSSPAQVAEIEVEIHQSRGGRVLLRRPVAPMPDGTGEAFTLLTTWMRPSVGGLHVLNMRRAGPPGHPRRRRSSTHKMYQRKVPLGTAVIR
jgi:hypothetical protein